MKPFRHIAAISIDNEMQAVRTIQMNKRQYLGDPINLAKIYYEYGADEIYLCNIDNASIYTFANLVNTIAKNIKIPLLAGGGIRSASDARILVNSGCERISLNSIAISNPATIDNISTLIGSQAISISLDYIICNYMPYIMASSGIKSLHSYLHSLQNHEFAELIARSIERSGKFAGPDLKILKLLRQYFPGTHLALSGGIVCHAQVEEIKIQSSLDGVVSSSLWSVENNQYFAPLPQPFSLA